MPSKPFLECHPLVVGLVAASSSVHLYRLAAHFSHAGMRKARETSPGTPCQAGLRAFGVERPLDRERLSLSCTLPIPPSPSLDEASSVTVLPPLLTLQRAVLRALGAFPTPSELSGTNFR